MEHDCTFRGSSNAITVFISIQEGTTVVSWEPQSWDGVGGCKQLP